MRKIYVLLLMGICLATEAQTFEGTLTYKVDFKVKTIKTGDFEITEAQVLEKMKRDGEYFDTVTVTIKGGSYVKRDNSPSQKTVIYKPDVNKLYTIQKDFEYVVITDGSKASPMKLVPVTEPSIDKTDSAGMVYNINCSVLTLTWDGLGTEQYYYNSDVAKINAALFLQHKYEYFNTVLALTNAYPLKIVKSLSDLISVTLTAVNISEHKVDDSLFVLPELKKAEKDYAEMMLKLTGSEVMKLRN